MGMAAVAVAAGSLFAGAAATAGVAGADPWKCESCGFPFPKVPDEVGWGHIPGPGWGNQIPWGHLPEGWH